jgi:hypothetical protein
MEFYSKAAETGTERIADEPEHREQDRLHRRGSLPISHVKCNRIKADEFLVRTARKNVVAGSCLELLGAMGRIQVLKTGYRFANLIVVMFLLNGSACGRLKPLNDVFR